MGSAIRISILANGRQARAEMAGVARSGDAMGRALGRTTKLVAGVFAISQLKRATGAVLETGGAYVSSLNQIKALTGATSAQVSAAARQLEGSSKSYAKLGLSTGDAAAGMVELTKSGLSLPKALGAIRGTMLLAKAGELEVADASELVANTLNTFSLKAREAAHVANSLANAANISSADVRDIGEAFKYVAPLAAKANISVDQTNAILAELANQGLKGSQAGTGFRKFLASLQAPTGAAAKALKVLNVEVYDAQGRMKPLPALIDGLNRGFGRLSDQEKNEKLKDLFGLTGITSANVILKNGSKGLAEYTRGVQRAGAAQKLAESQSKGLRGTIDQISASIKSTTESLYRQYSPAVDKALRGDVIPAVKETASAVLEAVKPITAGLVPAFKATAQVAGVVVDVFNAIPAPVKTLAIEAGIAALVLPRLAAGFTAATGAIGTNIAALRMWGTAAAATSTRSTAVGLAMLKVQAAARAAAGVGGLVALSEASRQSDDKMKILFNTLGGAAVGFSLGGPIGALIGGAGGGLLGIVSAAKKAGDAAKDMKADWSGLASTLDQVTGATTEATRAYIYDQLVRDKSKTGVLKQLQAEGLSRRQVVSGILGEKRAVQSINGVLDGHADRYKLITDQIKLLRKQQDSIRGVGQGPDEQKASLQRTIDGLQRRADAEKKVIDTIRSGTGAMKSSVKAVRERAAATTDFVRRFMDAEVKLPKRVLTRFETRGVPQSLAGWGRLMTRYHLTPKKVQTIAQVLGVDLSIKSLRRIQADADKTDRKRPTPKVRIDLGNSTAALRGIQREADVTDRKRPTPKVRVDTGNSFGILGSLQRALNGVARSYHASVTTTYHRVNVQDAPPGRPGIQQGDNRAYTPRASAVYSSSRGRQVQRSTSGGGNSVVVNNNGPMYTHDPKGLAREQERRLRDAMALVR